MPLTSTGGQYSRGRTYLHCFASQLPAPIVPLNFTNINVPVLMTVNPSPSYRVTECYQQVNMSFCHAFCMSLRTLRSGLR